MRLACRFWSLAKTGFPARVTGTESSRWRDAIASTRDACATPIKTRAISTGRFVICTPDDVRHFVNSKAAQAVVPPVIDCADHDRARRGRDARLAAARLGERGLFSARHLH